jgi:hypothetical protein
MQKSIKNIYQDRQNGIAFVDTLQVRVAVIVLHILILMQTIIGQQVAIIK